MKHVLILRTKDENEQEIRKEIRITAEQANNILTVKQQEFLERNRWVVCGDKMLIEWRTYSINDLNRKFNARYK